MPNLTKDEIRTQIDAAIKKEASNIIEKCSNDVLTDFAVEIRAAKSWMSKDMEELSKTPSSTQVMRCIVHLAGVLEVLGGLNAKSES